MKKNNPFASADWTEKSLNEMWNIIRKIAIEDFGMSFYEPYFEICTFEEMLQIYSTGFPIMFSHWAYGKDYENLYRKYKYNMQSIAYEVIFNTNPALCYLLETNTSTMQGLVMSHAAIGHSAFFKNNEFIRENTNANTIIDYLKNVRKYISECESNYGSKRVEEILDTCFALAMYAIDRSEVIEISKKNRDEKRIKRLEEKEKDFDLKVDQFKDEGEEYKNKNNRLKEQNILKYIAKHSPILKTWERELILMYCKIQQYFYPQMLTKVMNEGYASFWHYQLMNKLYDLEYLTEGNMMEFIHSHTSVLCQREHDEPGYGGLNPYKLGFEIFNDIKRICENPTEEDRFHFPDLIGKNWIEEVNFAAANFKDSSFILQYLSPKLVRDFKLFEVTNDSDSDLLEVTAIHDDEDFKRIRKNLSEKYNLFGSIPSVYIEGADLRHSRALYIVFDMAGKNKDIDGEKAAGVLQLIKNLWPYKIIGKVTLPNGEPWKGEF